MAYKIPSINQKGPNEEKTRGSSHLYYPIHKPTTSTSVKITVPQFCREVASIRRRDTDSYLREGRASLANAKLAKGSGIKGVSPLVSLPTISFPSSVPLDMMHLVHLGFIRDICALLSGQYFTNKKLNADQLRSLRGCMTAKDWVQLGVDMAKIGAPVSWGRFPRNIEKYIKGFKAEELCNFVIHYLLPLSFHRVDNSTYKQLQRLVLVLSLATSYEITYEEIEEIEKHLMIFLKWFYETYYQYREAQLPVCKYTVHSLLHMVDHIREWGPACYYWQYPEVLSPNIFV